jgi:geranylgeranylglycerol-phosphate geranylgeranyltransferase
VEIIEFFRRPKRKPVQIATSLVGLLLIIRIFTTFLIGLAVFLPLYLGGVGLAKSFYSSLPFFCIAAGGFAINDCCDLVADRINKPYRAIPSGRISQGVAKTVGVSLIVVGSLISVLVYHAPFQFALFVVSMAGVAFYNLIVKYLSLTKTILTAGVSVLPLVFVIKSLSYPTVYLLLPIAGMLFLLGRELLMDIRDVNGDRAANVKTLPILFGPRITAAIAFLFFALCSGVLMFFSVAVLSARNVILSSAISLVSLLLPCAWYYRSGSYRRVVILTLYVPIVCGILLLIR